MIRSLEMKDIEKIAEMWLKTNIKTHNFIDENYWKNNFEQVKEMFKTAEIYVYEENEILGFIGLENNYIAGIFVDEKFQSKSIGKQLLDFVKKIKDNLFLSVYIKNERAIKFYKRENFEIEKEQLDVSTGEKEYVMGWKSMLKNL